MINPIVFIFFKDCFGSKAEMFPMMIRMIESVEAGNNLINSLFAMKQRANAETATCRTEYERLNSQFKILTEKYDKVADYGNILDKLDTHMDDWKSELVNGLKKEINTEVTQVLKDNVPELAKSVLTELNSQSSLDVPKIIEESISKSDKKWSDIVKQNKEEFKKQTLEARKQTKLVEKSITDAKQKQAVENIERQKRIRNVVISNVQELETADSDEKRDEHDMKEAVDILGIESEDISKVYRVGARREDAAHPRRLVVVLESPDAAKRLHNFGRGRAIYKDNKIEHWVNPDLIKADRDANYRARNERRRRTDKREPSDSGQQAFRVDQQKTGD